MSDTTFDVIIIGAGPGGYVAAIRAAQLGLRAALVERHKSLGGTCLNVGCIPSKALLHSSHLYEEARKGFAAHGIKVEGLALDLPVMAARKARVVSELTRGIATLMKKNGVTVFEGKGRLAGGGRVEVTGADGAATVLTAAKNILIATGSVSTELPGMPTDGETVVTSTGALDFAEVPKHLVVVGGGAIGLELGSVWRRLGSKVTVVEMLPRIVPAMDVETGDALLRTLKKQGMAFRMETKVAVVERLDGGGLRLKLEGPGGAADAIECDKVLVSIGRRPFTEGLGLAEAGVELDERGRVKTDGSFRTTAAGVSAIGDVIVGPMLAHKAEEEGVAWAELLAGQPGHVDYDAIPSVVYTDPEAASVGLTEEQARERHGDDVRIGRFPFGGNGRAKAMAEREGFVKVISGPNDRLLGVHVFGPQASELIAEATIVLEFHGTAEDIARTCHAHPTLSEAVKEAALDAIGRVIHA